MNMFSRRANQRALDNEASRDLVIQLIEPASPAGAGAVERAAISQLREQGAVPIYLLVQQLASPLPPREGEEVIREKALGSVIAKEIFKFGLNQALFNSSG
jgi:hypothetical protein